MTMWRPDLKGRRGPRYVAIAEALADDVGSGRLKAGAQLPTHRDLADTLGVTVGTVSRAYAEAGRRGLLSGEVGRGTFVRGRPDAAIAHRPLDGLIDLALNHPPAAEGAPQVGAFAATLRALTESDRLARLLEYPPEGGLPEHREAGAEWMRRTALPTQAEEVVVCSGSQHAITSLLATLLQPGDLLLTETLTYPGLKSVAGLLHLRLHGLAMDHDGLRPDALDAACRTHAPRALYLLPTIHNPTAVLMPEGRRREIAEVARRHGLTIIEDDIHARLPEERPAPLASLAPELACYITSTSKTLAPGLRVGYVKPAPGLVDRLAATVRATTWGAAPLLAEVAARWIADGTAEVILAARRKEAAARQALARGALAGFDYQGHPNGYHGWLMLGEPWRSASFAAQVRRRGVAVTPADAFVVGRGSAPHGVRLCLGPARTREELKRGLQAVADVLRAPADAGLAIL